MHAGLERPAGVIGGERDGHACRPARLGQRPSAGRAVPVVRHVRVEIDQARDDRETG